jgi:hypothetical protein
VHFEVLGEIDEVETFAAESAIREIARRAESMDAVDGENAKASPVFG